jgi:hypothetical protein
VRAAASAEMPQPDGGESAETSWGRVPMAMLGGLVYAFAVAVRLPICLTRPLDGDEAVQGIAAQHLLDNGHWTWYFPGQKYGGTLETIPQALFQAIDEGSVFLLRFPLVLIAAGTVLLLSCLALELTRSRLAFVAVGVLASVFPPLYVFLGSWQTAGYNSSIFLGVTAVYVVIRAMRPKLSESRRTLMVGAAGLCAGLALYQQPQSVFVIAALATTSLVATWPRPLRLVTPGRLALFTGLAVLGAAPEVVALVGGVGSHTANNPLPPGYHLNGRLLTTVLGLHLFGTGAMPLLFPGGYESITWNALGVAYLDQLLVGEALAIAMSATIWLLVIGTLGSALLARRRSRPAGHEAVLDSGRAPSMYVPLAAGALVAAVVVSLAVIRLPPYAKYGYGLFGFAAFAFAIVAVQLRSRRPVAAALLACVLWALVVVSVKRTIETFDDGRKSPLPHQESWLLSQARAVSSPPGGKVAMYGDYWIVYPLEFRSHGALQATPSSFDRFPSRVSGDVPAGRVVVPIVPDLPFHAQVDAMVRAHCTVQSTQVNGEVRLLVAQCV